jgi:hypothetical protein
MRDYASNVCQFIGLFFVHAGAFDFSGNSVDTFSDVNHVLESVLNVVLEVFLVGIEVHVFFFNTDVKETCLSFLFHFVKQQSHGLVVDSN